MREGDVFAIIRSARIEEGSKLKPEIDEMLKKASASLETLSSEAEEKEKIFGTHESIIPMDESDPLVEQLFNPHSSKKLATLRYVDERKKAGAYIKPVIAHDMVVKGSGFSAFDGGLANTSLKGFTYSVNAGYTKNTAGTAANQWATDSLLDVFNVLEARAMSFTAFHELPPNCYNHSVSRMPRVPTAAFDLASEHWSVLLEAEAAHNAGAHIGPLGVMHWRHSPDASQARRLQLILAKTLGDSRLVDRAHQHAKDLLRSAKQGTFANTAIMAKLLTAEVLENSGLKTVKHASAGMAQASMQGPKVEAVTKSLNKPGQAWPSPSPATLFQSAAGAEWLLHFGRTRHPLTKV